MVIVEIERETEYLEDAVRIGSLFTVLFKLGLRDDKDGYYYGINKDNGRVVYGIVRVR